MPGVYYAYQYDKRVERFEVLSFEKEASTNPHIFVVRNSVKKKREVFEKWVH